MRKNNNNIKKITKRPVGLRNIKKFALYKDFSGQELSVEPVEMSALVESMKQEAHPIASGVGG